MHGRFWREAVKTSITRSIIGNAAVLCPAALMALKNKMDLALSIAIGSSLQITPLVAPVLVFISYALVSAPLNLVFTPLQGLRVVRGQVIILYGECNWTEGVQLLAVYPIVALALYFPP